MKPNDFFDNFYDATWAALKGGSSLEPYGKRTKKLAAACLDLPEINELVNKVRQLEPRVSQGYTSLRTVLTKLPA